MLGYLNSQSPFDKEGYCTKDIVKEDQDDIKIFGIQM